MTHNNRVLQSINLSWEARCVDIFVRDDETFGFEEFRRDPEDDRGWFPIGSFGSQVFGSEDLALACALLSVVWLQEELDRL